MQNLSQPLKDKIIKLAETIRDSYEFILAGVKNNDFEKLENIPFDAEAFKQLLKEFELAFTAEFMASQNQIALLKYIKISHAIEKVGLNAAKSHKLILFHLDESFKHTQIFTDIVKLYETSFEAVTKACEALITSCSANSCHEYLSLVSEKEAQTDELLRAVYREIIISNYREELYIKAALDIFNVVRRLERAADHSADIVKLLCDS